MKRLNVIVLGSLMLLSTAFVRPAMADPKPEPPKKRIVGIVIYDGVETLDFAGPYEVFALAHKHDAAAADAEPGMMGPMRRVFDVRVVAATTQPVAVSGGLKVVPTDTFASCPQVDVLVVPGGGHGAAVADKALVAWVARQAAGAELVTSVCTGSFILAEAGLLDGKRSATNHLSVDDMQAKYPKTTVIAGRRVVEDGNVVTAAGVSSGLDMALFVVGKLYGTGVARMAADIIEYPYPLVDADAKR